MNSARLPKRRVYSAEEAMTEPIHRVAALPESDGQNADRPGLAEVVQAVQEGRRAARPT